MPNLSFFSSEVSIISSNLSILIDVGLGERGKRDFSLAKNVCLALCKLAPVKLKTDDPHHPFRYEFFDVNFLFYYILRIVTRHRGRKEGKVEVPKCDRIATRGSRPSPVYHRGLVVRLREMNSRGAASQTSVSYSKLVSSYDTPWKT